MLNPWRFNTHRIVVSVITYSEMPLARTPNGPNDTAIAGHAAGAVLVTSNVREFERAPGLLLEDWVK